MRSSDPLTRVRLARQRGGFTLVEVLVVLGVLAVLVGLLVPTATSGRARSRAMECAKRLQQIGVGLALYTADHGGALPQVVQGPDDARVFTGAPFGGERGRAGTGVYGAFGPEDRPLNRYVSGVGSPQPDVFNSPADRGGVLPAIGTVSSLYKALGSSYTLNERTLKPTPGSPETRTLIPAAGGPVPQVRDPARTWLAGSWPVMNYDEGADRELRWYAGGAAHTNLLFVDNHLGTMLFVPEGTATSTGDYSFLP